MKILITIIYLLLLERINSQLTCNQQLMESYGINGQKAVLNIKNNICGGVKNNCCGNQAQLDIFKKWSVKETDKKIQEIYRSINETMQNAFNAFSRVEAFAIQMIPLTSDIINSQCLKISQAIQNMTISKNWNKVQTTLLKAVTFLQNARSGFYCSLCEANTHQYYNLSTSTFQTSSEFCGKMAGNLLNYYIFRNKYFPKITRLYAQWTVSCDLNGNFDPRAVLKSSVKLFTRSAFGGNLEQCFNGFDKPGAVTKCRKLCARFNPVKLDIYFEGELDKINSLSYFLNLRLNEIQAKYDSKTSKSTSKDEATEKDDKSLGGERRLQDNTVDEEDEPVPRSPSKLLNEEISEVSYFNRYFKTGLLVPMSYEYKLDYKIKFNNGFYDSLFEVGTENIYNLREFKNLVNVIGIDFDFYAIGSNIDYASAKIAFTQLNLDNITMAQYLGTVTKKET